MNEKGSIFLPATQRPTKRRLKLNKGGVSYGK